MTISLTHRVRCQLHFLRRAEERGLDITAEEIADLETLIERARPAFVTPGQDRYILTIKRGRIGRRLTVVYDTTLRCLVTPLRRSEGVSHV